MRLRINGESREFASPPASVEALVEALGLLGDRIAVEVNGQIVRRGHRDQHPLHHDDAVEIVTLVGGG